MKVRVPQQSTNRLAISHHTYTQQQKVMALLKFISSMITQMLFKQGIKKLRGLMDLCR